jgi:hypothetical protein
MIPGIAGIRKPRQYFFHPGDAREGKVAEYFERFAKLDK